MKLQDLVGKCVVRKDVRRFKRWVSPIMGDGKYVDDWDGSFSHDIIKILDIVDGIFYYKYIQGSSFFKGIHHGMTTNWDDDQWTEYVGDVIWEEEKEENLTKGEYTCDS